MAGTARLRGILVLVGLLAVSGAASAAEIPLSRNYADIKAFMNGVAAANPKTTEVFTLGVSDSGDTIQGLKIGDGQMKSLVVATHHGNEYGSTEVAKAFAASIAEAPIAGQTVYVIPVLNIGGFNARSRYEIGNDPNRDYPGPCGTDGPFRLKSTKALADFIDKENIVASATLHTYWPVVVYPWGISTHDLSTPYDDQFAQLCKAATVESGYETGNNTQLIYPADGTFEDYAFWKHGIWSLLFELGSSHNPSEAQVRQMQKVNTPGLRRFLEQAPRQRAERHAFEGRCDKSLKSLDRRDE